MTDLNKLTKAQLIERLNEAEEKTTRSVNPGNLFIQRDPKVKKSSTKKNPYWGYITIPEGMHGEFRIRVWTHRKNKDRLRGTFLPYNKDD